jgi:hypothetical protein
MTLKGNLTDVSLADLIQLQCQSGATACLRVQGQAQTAELYVTGGELVHAQAGDLQGEEVVYQLLAWQSGAFEVEQGVSAPAQTIQMPWSMLVMEGLRRLDEGMTVVEPQPNPAPVANPLETAVQLLATRSSFEGLLVVSRAGAVLAAVLPSGLEQNRVGAVAAGLLGLADRSVQQLARGSLQQTLVQGTQGNIIITQAGPGAALVALADPALNLGLAFLEARESAQTLTAQLNQIE